MTATAVHGKGATAETARDAELRLAVAEEGMGRVGGGPAPMPPWRGPCDRKQRIPLNFQTCVPNEGWRKEALGSNQPTQPTKPTKPTQALGSIRMYSGTNEQSGPTFLGGWRMNKTRRSSPITDPTCI